MGGINSDGKKTIKMNFIFQKRKDLSIFMQRAAFISGNYKKDFSLIRTKNFSIRVEQIS